MKWTDSRYSKIARFKRKALVQDRVKLLLFLICLVFSRAGFSQNVGINGTGTAPGA